MPVTIGIDPHKSTHTAVAVDRDEHQLACLTLPADRQQTDRLLAWAEPLDTDRVWAIESAAGLGRLLAQQLLAAGEHVIDVPPTLTARVRVLGSSKASKNDPNDALATATPGCVTVVCATSRPMVTRRSCDCWPTAITTSPGYALKPRAGST